MAEELDLKSPEYKHWEVTSFHDAVCLRSIVGSKNAIQAIRVHCEAMEKEHGVDIDTIRGLRVAKWTPLSAESPG